MKRVHRKRFVICVKFIAVKISAVIRSKQINLLKKGIVMRKKSNMSHIIIAGAIIVASLFVILLFKNRVSNMISTGSVAQNDLVFINDSADIISVRYTKDGKDVSASLKPNEQIVDGKGRLKVFVAGKGGSYDLVYTFPRPTGSTEQVRLSQVIKAAHAQEEKLTAASADDMVLTEKGMVGDVKVEYEEVMPT